MYQYDPAQDRRAVNEHSIDSYNDSYNDGIGHEFFSFIQLYIIPPRGRRRGRGVQLAGTPRALRARRRGRAGHGQAKAPVT
jgi:hypothetical protein